MSGTSITAFQVNDYIYHGSGGVCVVADICKLNSRRADPDQTYYRLQPLYDKGSVIYTPIDGGKATVRKLMNRDEANELVREIPELETLWIDNDKTREETYREALKTGDCREWVRVIKTLYLRNQARITGGKRTTQTDEKYLQKAEDLLYGELAIALDIPKDEVQSFITRRVEESEGEQERCS